jgi:hypothetical protein
MLKFLQLKQNDAAYLDGNIWEHLLSCYMPKVRIFDIKHEGCV